MYNVLKNVTNLRNSLGVSETTKVHALNIEKRVTKLAYRSTQFMFQEFQRRRREFNLTNFVTRQKSYLHSSFADISLKKTTECPDAFSRRPLESKYSTNLLGGPVDSTGANCGDCWRNLELGNLFLGFQKSFVGNNKNLHVSGDLDF